MGEHIVKHMNDHADVVGGTNEQLSIAHAGGRSVSLKVAD
jgi:hypothetical protein